MEQLLELCDHAHIKHVHNYIEPKLQRDYISELPRELILLLLTYVRPKDLYKLAQVSHYFHQIANDPILWKNICKRSKIVVNFNAIRRSNSQKNSIQEENESKVQPPKSNNRKHRNINNDNMSYITNDEEDDDDDDLSDDQDFYYSLEGLSSNSNNTNNNNNNNLQVNYNSLEANLFDKTSASKKASLDDDDDDNDDYEEIEDDDDTDEEEEEDDGEDAADEDIEETSEKAKNPLAKKMESETMDSANIPTTSSGGRVRSPASPSSCSSTEQNKSNQSSQSKAGINLDNKSKLNGTIWIFF